MWWRAWVLWPDNRVVRWVGVIMIFLTTSAHSAWFLALMHANFPSHWRHRYERCVQGSTVDPHVQLGWGRRSSDSEWRVPQVHRRFVGHRLRIVLSPHECSGNHVDCIPCLVRPSIPLIMDVLQSYCLGTISHREHRRIVALYLKRSSRRSQLERTLALLVESGLLYCVLCVSISPDDRGITHT